MGLDNNRNIILTTEEKNNLKNIVNTGNRLTNYYQLYLDKSNVTLDTLRDDFNNLLNNTKLETDGRGKLIFTKGNEVNKFNLELLEDIYDSPTINTNDTFSDINIHSFRPFCHLDNSHNAPVYIDRDPDSISGKVLKVRGYVNLWGKDILQPFDTRLEYRIRAEFKFTDTNNNPIPNHRVLTYWGVSPRDISGRYIGPQNLYIAYGTKSYVTRKAKKGDRVIFVRGDITKWYKGNYYYYRGIGVWPKQDDGSYSYVDDKNVQYDEFGYTRLSHYHLYGAGDDKFVDLGNGEFKIKLNSDLPWDINVGDAIGNTRAGGTYNYWWSGTKPVDGEYHSIESDWEQQDFNLSPLIYWHKFRNGCVYLRPIILTNYRHYDENNNSISSSNILMHIKKLSLDYRIKK